MTGPFILSTARHARGPVLIAEEKRVAQGWELGGTRLTPPHPGP